MARAWGRCARFRRQARYLRSRGLFRVHHRQRRRESVTIHTGAALPLPPPNRLVNVTLSHPAHVHRAEHVSHLWNWRRDGRPRRRWPVYVAHRQECRQWLTVTRHAL